MDWHENANLNSVTKSCIKYSKDNFSFEEYLDDRAKKDAKFVNIHEEEDAGQDQNEQEDKADSEFSFSDDGETKESNTKGEAAWDRAMAQTYYDSTRTEIETRLINGAIERENQANFHSQQIPENGLEDLDQSDGEMKNEEQDTDLKIEI